MTAIRHVSHLRELEAEAVFVIREVTAERSHKHILKFLVTRFGPVPSIQFPLAESWRRLLHAGRDRP